MKMNNIILDKEMNKAIFDAVISGKWAHLSIEELKNDLDDAYGDLLNCECALKLGITRHSGIDTKYRIEENKKQIVIIETELKRRNETR